eukprot:894993_1
MRQTNVRRQGIFFHGTRTQRIRLTWYRCGTESNQGICRNATIILQRDQIDHIRRSRCHDERCTECIEANYRKVYQECEILSHLQLCIQNYSSVAISLYEVRFAPLAREQIHDRLLEVAKSEEVEYTENGIEAILSLSGGDMRRVLNLLQTTAMSSKQVDESTVYLTSGAPLPKDIDVIVKSLFNDQFSVSYSKITTLCKTKGYAMADILSDLTTVVSSMELPAGALAEILDGMSGVEYRLASGTDEAIQCAGLVGVFIQARSLMTVA